MKFSPVDVDPRSAGRVLCLPEDVSAVVDAVEIDRLAVIICPRTVRWWRKPDHLQSCKVSVFVRRSDITVD